MPAEKIVAGWGDLGKQDLTGELSDFRAVAGNLFLDDAGSLCVHKVRA